MNQLEQIEQVEHIERVEQTTHVINKDKYNTYMK